MIDVYYTRRLFKNNPVDGTIQGVACAQKKKYSFGYAVEFTDVIYVRCQDVSYRPDLNSEVTRIKSWTI